VERGRSEPLVKAPRCPFCHADVERGQEAKVCSSCHAIHHDACFGEGAGCSACGARVVETTAPAPAPASRERSNRVAIALVIGVAAGCLGAFFGYRSEPSTIVPPPIVDRPPAVRSQPSLAPPSDEDLLDRATSCHVGALALYQEGLKAGTPRTLATRLFTQAIALADEGLARSDRLASRLRVEPRDPGALEKVDALAHALRDLRSECVASVERLAPK
jgi:hypothetical protein